MRDEQIDKAVDEIVADIQDRRGLKYEWTAIDKDIQEEIKDNWRSIIKKHVVNK